MPPPTIPPPKLSPSEIDRYKRHLVLREVGGQGQQKLKAARVLLIGAGGLGSPLVMYLAAAGVGTIGVVDDDTVSLDNLQRQIAHDTPSVGMAKVESAKASVARLNPHVVIEAHRTRLDAGNALELIRRYDIVADGSDNFRHPLPRRRRLLFRQEAAGLRCTRSARRLCLGLQAICQDRRWYAVSDTPLFVS